VLYRRVDDDYLDPLNFRADSFLGVPGIFDVYRAGGITIANAPGTGIADDKAIYSYMPDIVQFYTGEKPILKNVPTWRCSEASSLAYVLDHLANSWSRKCTAPAATACSSAPPHRRRSSKPSAPSWWPSPSNYIAQPTLALSTVPILTAPGSRRAMSICGLMSWCRRTASRSRRAA
jgi:uncharacterized circularly permuted ATP-grasp superfamily protein